MLIRKLSVFLHAKFHKKTAVAHIDQNHKMYYKLTDSELRGVCKQKLESLEYWLRRIIDELLKSEYNNYFEYIDGGGDRLIKAAIVRSLKSRKQNEPGRYPRLIDAVLLDDAIDIICKPESFKNHFKEVLKDAFPDGREEARTYLKRLIPARNSLSHANPISVRQAEQVICYSNDIIDSIKNFYTEKNMDNDYNVPLILKVIDSFGNVFHRNQMNNVHDGGIMKVFYNDPSYNLRVGDTVTIEVEVDPSFDENEYTITWSSAKGFTEPLPNGKKAIIQISEQQVAQSFDVQCRVKSNKNWHRMHLGADDFMLLYYKVLPPV